MGVLDMNDIIFHCCRPFKRLLRVMSDYPVSFSFFVSLLAAMITQDIGFGTVFFLGMLGLMAVVYILTFGHAFGRGGLKPDHEIRS